MLVICRLRKTVYKWHIISENVMVTSGVRRTKVEYSIIKRYREYAVVIKPTLTLWRDTCPPPDRGACVSASSDVGHGIVGGTKPKFLPSTTGQWHEQVSELLLRDAVSHVPDEKLLCSFTPPVLPPPTRGYSYFHLSALEVLTIE